MLPIKRKLEALLPYFLIQVKVGERLVNITGPTIFVGCLIIGIFSDMQATKVERHIPASILNHFLDSLRKEGYRLEKGKLKKAGEGETPLLAEMTSSGYENLYSTWVHYLKYREGYRPIMYLCPAGYRTIGYGHNIDAHGPLGSDTIKYSRASELLHQDLEKQYKEIRNLLPHLGRPQHLAITSLAANCGLYKIMYVRGDKKKGYSTFWKECMKVGGKPNFKVYCKYKTPKGKVCTSTNLVNARAFEEMLYYGRKTAKFQFGKAKVEMSYAQVGEFFRQNVVRRDIKKNS